MPAPEFFVLSPFEVERTSVELRMMMRSRSWTPATAALALLLGACGDEAIVGNTGSPTGDEDPVSVDGPCSVDPDLLVSSVPPDAIPALTLPSMVSPDDPGAEYLDDDSRVLGIVMNGEARAYPHNILWWHEVVNDRIGPEWISVTFCPLTGSGLAFDPHVGTTRLELAVSGLLFANNLVLFDRISGGVYGPQLSVPLIRAWTGRTTCIRTGRTTNSTTTTS